MAKASAAKRRNNNAWDAKNMATIGTRVRKEIAEEFKQYAQARGTKANTLLKNYILQCLGRTDNTPEPAREDPDPQQVTDCISECLRLIQRAAEENQPTE